MNIFAAALINERKRTDQLAALQNWHMSERNRLVEILESNGIVVTNHVYGLLLWGIGNLYLQGDSIAYSNRGKPSRKVHRILKDNMPLIAENGMPEYFV